MLVEREKSLAVIAAALDEALGGHGRLLFVGGDAGVGKTAVVTAAAERVPANVRVRRGVIDNVTTPVALGALVEAVPELLEFVEATKDVGRASLFRRLRAAVSTEPTLLVLEDVHWADEATLDMLRFLGRRLDELNLLVLATYRAEEVSARHPLSVVLGDLATARGVGRLTVEPMTPAAIGELIAAAGSTIDPAGLHELTGGNAFYVTEVLAAPADDLPATVRDAVLARAARRSPAAWDVLAAAAVLGQPADSQLLSEVSEQQGGSVDECVEYGLLVAARGGWAFRHELARMSIERSLAPGRITDLNRRAFTALRARGVDDDRRLAHHAAIAGDGAAAHVHAVRAAGRAARLGAHRESAEQYRLALRTHDGDLGTREDLLVALSYECYLTDELDEALVARLKAMELGELRGDLAAVGRHQRWVSRLSWFLGRNADSERYALRAIATLESGGDSHELAMAYSNKAQLCMLASDVDGTEHWGGRALALARRTGDREVQIHALNNIGTAQVQRDDAIEGRALVRRSLDLALADDAHEHAARAYTNLGSLAVTNRRLADADEVLRAGIAYCTDRDLDSWRLYMSAHLARSRAEQGRYDEAAAGAADVLRNPNLAPVSAIVASTAAAQVALRRGDDASSLLSAAWELAAGTGEAQRLVPVAVTLAEADWLTGRTDATAALDAAWSAAAEHPVGWEAAELAFWRTSAGLPIGILARVPTPFALMLDQRWRAAADAWRDAGCPLWQAYALTRHPTIEAGREALAIVERLGAPAVRDAIARSRRASGLPVPRGPRVADRDNPAALSAREFEVLQLLADGLSNADIAARLFLSEKTAGHHVSAVLRKVGEPTRARAAAWAVRRGLVSQPHEPAVAET